MPKICLNHRSAAVRKALVAFNLAQKKRIGKGQFCAVYDNEDGTVSKLTLDSVAFEGVRSYFHSPHLPQMLHNEGIVGEHGLAKNSLYLFTTPKLLPLSKAKSVEKRLAAQLGTEYETSWTNAWEKVRHIKDSGWKYAVARSRVILEALKDRPSLPQAIREALEEIYRMARDFDNLMLDFKRTNLMVTEDGRLILNDVIARADFCCCF